MKEKGQVEQTHLWRRTQVQTPIPHLLGRHFMSRETGLRLTLFFSISSTSILSNKIEKKWPLGIGEFVMLALNPDPHLQGSSLISSEEGLQLSLFLFLSITPSV